MDGWMDGWMDGYMTLLLTDGWMDGRIRETNDIMDRHKCRH